MGVEGQEANEINQGLRKQDVDYPAANVFIPRTFSFLEH